MSPCRAELRLFGSLLAAGAAPIGGYAEQDFLNWRYQAGFERQRCCRGLHGLLCLSTAPPTSANSCAVTDFLQSVLRLLPPAFNAQRGIRRHHPQLWEMLWPQVSCCCGVDALLCVPWACQPVQLPQD